MSKGSSRRPTLVPKEVADTNHERIFGITCKRCGKRGLQPDSVHTCSPQINEPRIGTPEREAWQDEKNRKARALLDAMPIKESEK